MDRVVESVPDQGPDGEEFGFKGFLDEFDKSRRPQIAGVFESIGNMKKMGINSLDRVMDVMDQKGLTQPIEGEKPHDPTMMALQFIEEAEKHPEEVAKLQASVARERGKNG